MRHGLLILFLIFIFVGAVYWRFVFQSSPVQELSESMKEIINLQTQDGVQIVGDYYSTLSSKGVLLVHMMPSDRKSWRVFAEKLAQAGFQALAIDLRGHGESEDGPEGYKTFTDAEHQASIKDLEAGVEFLRKRGVEKLYLVGASIGANLSLQYGAGRDDVAALVLMSPGLDYRGIKTEELVSHLKESQGIYLVASEEDSYSFNSVKTLSQKIQPDNQIRVSRFFRDAGHGTQIFEKHPEFMDEVVRWLSQF